MIFFSSSMCKCRIISFGKGLPQNYICSRDFHFKDLAISSFRYAWDSNMKTSMKNRWGGIIVCLMQRFEYIIVLSILFIITENIFVMPFSPLDVKKPLIKRFLCRFKGRWGCSGCWNRCWKWLSPPTRVSDWWFHHRYVTLARSDNSFSLKPHGKNYLLHMKSEEDKYFIKIVEIDQI